ncbi:MAG: hypothetical protein K2X01_10240 [Cyanobacteria bacterium]|nr:hypothetical protein [Cyanobacteriota bacterium]
MINDIYRRFKICAQHPATRGMGLIEVALVVLIISLAILPMLSMKGLNTANVADISLVGGNRSDRRELEALLTIYARLMSQDPTIGVNFAALPLGYYGTKDCGDASPMGGCTYTNGGWSSKYKIYLEETTYRKPQGQAANRIEKEDGTRQIYSPGDTVVNSARALPQGFRMFSVSILFPKSGNVMAANLPITTTPPSAPVIGKVGVVFVVDISGSMTGNDNNNAQAMGINPGFPGGTLASPFMNNRYPIWGNTVDPSISLNPWDDSQLDIVYGALSNDLNTPYDDRYPQAGILGLPGTTGDPNGCNPYQYQLVGPPLVPNPDLPRMHQLFYFSSLNAEPNPVSPIVYNWGDAPFYGPGQNDFIYHLCMPKSANYAYNSLADTSGTRTNYNLPYLRNYPITAVNFPTGANATNDALLTQKLSRMEAVRSGLLASLVKIENTPAIMSDSMLDIAMYTFDSAFDYNSATDTGFAGLLLPPESPKLGNQITTDTGGGSPIANRKYYENARKRFLGFNRRMQFKAILARSATGTRPAIAAGAQALCNMGDTYSDRIMVLMTDGEPNYLNGGGGPDGYETMYQLGEALRNGSFTGTNSPVLSDGTTPNPGYFGGSLPAVASMQTVPTCAGKRFKTYVINILRPPGSSGYNFLNTYATRSGGVIFNANRITDLKPMFDAIVYQVIVAVQQAQMSRAYAPPP